MKVTLKQIEMAVQGENPYNTQYVSEDTYFAIKENEDEAIRNANIPKSIDHYAKSDWKKVYQEIQKIIKAL